jgi:hypothetical protein
LLRRFGWQRTASKNVRAAEIGLIAAIDAHFRNRSPQQSETRRDSLGVVECSLTHDIVSVRVIVAHASEKVKIMREPYLILCIEPVPILLVCEIESRGGIKAGPYVGVNRGKYIHIRTRIIWKYYI